ncbi:hypothetical protein AB0J82_15590 [Asanoa sp. NPDC049518]|uniref:hypothetical protein n=1 Tax=unclassified Asanoa TaxID=2685164 RepID=UPI003444A60F
MRWKFDPLLFVQLGALWFLGGMLMPSAVGPLALALFGGALYVGIALLIGLSLLVGYLWAVVTLTARVSRLGATVPSRLLWVVVIDSPLASAECFQEPGGARVACPSIASCCGAPLWPPARRPTPS